jgi:intracellular septation protein
VFGGATIILQNELFIKWKPTILYALFAAAFTISHFVGERTVVERMMGKSIQLPEPVWTRLNVAWSIFFLFLGGLNLYVAYNFSTDAWVNFKLFGMTGLMIAFVIVQAFFLSKYLEVEDEKEDVVRDPRE